MVSPKDSERKKRGVGKAAKKKKAATPVITNNTNASSEKENTANKSISFDAQQGPLTSFGSPAKDSVVAKKNNNSTKTRKKKGTALAAEELQTKIDTRQPVGLRNQIKQEPKVRAKRKNPDKSSAVSGQESEQLLRNATELIASEVREQMGYHLMEDQGNSFAFGSAIGVSRKEDMNGYVMGTETQQFLENGLMFQLPSQPSKTPPARNAKKNKNGIIQDPRDLVGCSPPSTFKPQINSDDQRPARGAAAKSLCSDFNLAVGIGNRSQVVKTDIFEATNHARSPNMAGGRHEYVNNGNVSNRSTPTNSARNTPLGLGLKASGLPPVLDIKTQDMSMIFSGDGVTQLLDKCLGDMTNGGEGETMAAKAGGGGGSEQRQFAVLFGNK